MMSSNTNNSDQSEILARLYKELLYKKEDIIAIQKKLGIDRNIDQTALDQSKKAKTLDDSYELLFDLVEELKLIQEKFDITPSLQHFIKIKKLLWEYLRKCHIGKYFFCFYIWKRIYT